MNPLHRQIAAGMRTKSTWVMPKFIDQTTFNTMVTNSTRPTGPGANASMSNMGVDLTGTLKWAGSVVAPNGKIYCIPNYSQDILVIDPATETAVRTNMGANLSGTQKWYGGALGLDGKIYCMPYNAPDILIIDPATDTAVRTNMGVTLGAREKWFGGVLGPDGKIYGIPSSTKKILIIDPATGTAALKLMAPLVNWLSLGATRGLYMSGCLSTDGRIVGIPAYSKYGIFINTTNHRVEIHNNGLGISPSFRAKWSSGVFCPISNKIYAIPRDYNEIMYLDCTTRKYAKSNFGLSLGDTDKWSGGVFGADGKVYGMPRASSTILVIDPATSTATRTNMGGSWTGTGNWAGGSLAANGKIYGVPNNAEYILIIDPDAGSFPMELVLDARLNKY